MGFCQARPDSSLRLSRLRSASATARHARMQSDFGGAQAHFCGESDRQLRSLASFCSPTRAQLRDAQMVSAAAVGLLFSAIICGNGLERCASGALRGRRRREQSEPAHEYGRTRGARLLRATARSSNFERADIEQVCLCGRAPFGPQKWRPNGTVAAEALCGRICRGRRAKHSKGARRRCFKGRASR